MPDLSSLRRCGYFRFKIAEILSIRLYFGSLGISIYYNE